MPVTPEPAPEPDAGLLGHLAQRFAHARLGEAAQTLRRHGYHVTNAEGLQILVHTPTFDRGLRLACEPLVYDQEHLWIRDVVGGGWLAPATPTSQDALLAAVEHALETTR